MSTSSSPRQKQPPAVQQPSPLSRAGAPYAHTPTVELLEQNAEHMSFRDSSPNRPSNDFTSYTPRAQQSPHLEYGTESFDHFDYVQPRSPSVADSQQYEAPIHSQDVADQRVGYGAYNFPSQRHLAAPKANSSVSRGPSTASGSTMRNAGSLFKDFDGTHYAPPSESAYGYVDDDNQLPAENQQSPVDPQPADLTHEPSNHNRTKSEFDDMFDNIFATKPEDDPPDASKTPQEAPNTDAKIDILPSEHHKAQLGAPPPADGMVYYPAPVPMQLNRPQRLSQHPTSNLTTAQRRSQILGTIPPKLRQSAVWMGPEDFSSSGAQNEKSQPDDEKPSKSHHSGMNLKKLPPQLRASVFFDQPSVQQRVKVKHGSAVATLDSLLDASARAPRNATVDETLRNAMDDLEDQPKQASKVEPTAQTRKSRLSFFPLKNSSSDKLSSIRQRASSMLGFDHLTGEVLVEEHEEEKNDEDDESVNNERTPLAPGSSASSRRSSLSEGEEEEEALDGNDDNDAENSEDGDSDQEAADEAERKYLGAPTTLLAELQLRKQELKSRNRTAATAFPNGMHSTLLEMDAVAQIEKKKRQTRRTALAWEDPQVLATKKELPDENVPLGMLFPNKNGLANSGKGGSDWDRPLGLLERRDLEDHEPLSKRRNRLKGINPKKAAPEQPQPPIEATAEESESEHEGETLAQRTRRLKSAKALNDAVGDAAGERSSKDFAGELMSQFGPHEEPTKLTEAPAPEASGGEETLGQRRRRLLAEGKSNHAVSASSVQQQLRQTSATKTNLANLLASNPVGGIRHTSGGSATAGLLRQNEQTRTERRNHISQQNHLSSANLLVTPLIDPNVDMDSRRYTASGLLEANQNEVQSRRQHIQDTNYRSTNAGIDAPLVGQAAQNHTPGGLLGLSETERNLSGFAAGTYNDGSGGVVAAGPRQGMRSSSAFPHQQSQSNVFRQGFGSSGFGISPRHMSSSHPNSSVQPPVGSPAVMASVGDLSQSEDVLSTKQRENIDRWRQSVMP